MTTTRDAQRLPFPPGASHYRSRATSWLSPTFAVRRRVRWATPTKSIGRHDTPSSRRRLSSKCPNQPVRPPVATMVQKQPDYACRPRYSGRVQQLGLPCEVVAIVRLQPRPATPTENELPIMYRHP
ncbi:hypothetical protein CMUS01_10120 [Colletotrichum musicola]|uniref:Uncharacterized protein n=1 Tax=Colletotrichum musicola TaxID=2175873 RepID=A0A8H6K5C3_9PEZI|nr:hypothetical protein CMUS01_10120 [Colletotrichum musicola]